MILVRTPEICCSSMPMRTEKSRRNASTWSCSPWAWKSPRTSVDLAERLGIALTEGRFCATHPFTPVRTSKDGIYVCGAFQGPKDIPQSVMEASAAACAASRGPEPGPLEPRPRPRKSPRRSMFQLWSRGSASLSATAAPTSEGSWMFPAWPTYASTLPHVVHVEQNLFTCAQDTQDRMKGADCRNTPEPGRGGRLFTQNP